MMHADECDTIKNVYDDSIRSLVVIAVQIYLKYIKPMCLYLYCEWFL